MNLTKTKTNVKLKTSADVSSGRTFFTLGGLIERKIGLALVIALYASLIFFAKNEARADFGSLKQDSNTGMTINTSFDYECQTITLPYDATSTGLWLMSGSGGCGTPMSFDIRTAYGVPTSSIASGTVASSMTAWWSYKANLSNLKFTASSTYYLCLKVNTGTCLLAAHYTGGGGTDYFPYGCITDGASSNCKISSSATYDDFFWFEGISPQAYYLNTTTTKEQCNIGSTTSNRIDWVYFTQISTTTGSTTITTGVYRSPGIYLLFILLVFFSVAAFIGYSVRRK